MAIGFQIPGARKPRETSRVVRAARAIRQRVDELPVSRMAHAAIETAFLFGVMRLFAWELGIEEITGLSGPVFALFGLLSALAVYRWEDLRSMGI